MMKRALIAILCVLALAGCATTPQMPDPAAQMGALETRIAILVEEERHRLSPAAKSLAIDPELSLVARARARDMAAKNYLAHAAPNGDTSASLLMSHDAKWQGLLGENLAAQHYTKQGGVSVDAFAKRFLDEWLNSPPHRDNMAFVNYDRTGVGAAVNGDTVYVALLFSTDLGMKPRADDAPANTVTNFDSPASASAAPATLMPDPLRLRGAVVPQAQNAPR
jgi:uncharacterized protein YkwD